MSTSVAQLKEEVAAQEHYAAYLEGCVSSLERLMADREAQIAAFQKELAELKVQKEKEEAALAAARDAYVSACERLSAAQPGLFAAQPNPEPSTEPVAEVKPKRSPPIPWRKSSFVLASNEAIFQATEALDKASPSKQSKFHPRSEMPAKIIGLLAKAPERRLSYQALICDLKLGLDLKDTLQTYLRALKDQGILSVALPA